MEYHNISFLSVQTAPAIQQKRDQKESVRLEAKKDFCTARILDCVFVYELNV